MARPPTWWRPGGPAGCPSCARTSPSAPSTCATPPPWGPTPCCSSWPPWTTANWGRSWHWPGDLGLAPLVEVHDEAELERALAAGADLVGVNQRDLRDLRGRPRARPLRMGERMPPGVVAVAESGIRDAADVERLAGAGYTAVLVGETLVRSADRTSAVDGLAGRTGVTGPADRRRRAGALRQDLRVTSEADALLAVGMGASAVGFVFAPSPRQMAPSAVADIVKRLPHETVTVGVFRDESPRRVVEIAGQIGLRAVQLHGFESAEDTRWVADRVELDHQGLPGRTPQHRALPRVRRPDAAGRRAQRRARGSCSTGGWPRVSSTRAGSCLGRPPARQRGRGRRPPPPVGCRRGQRRRVVARGEGPGQGPRLRAGRPGGGPRALAEARCRRPDRRRRGRTTPAPAGDRPVRLAGRPDRVTRDRCRHGRSRAQRALRGLRRPLRARVAGAGLHRARGGLPGRVGRPGVPGRARRHPAQLRGPSHAGHRVRSPVRPSSASGSS